jgi:hypothetical protein
VFHGSTTTRVTTTPRSYLPALGLLLTLWLGVHGHALAKRKVGCSRAESTAGVAAVRAKTLSPPPKAAAIAGPAAPSKASLLASPAAPQSAPWFRAKPQPTARIGAEHAVDPREPVPEYRCRTASASQCRDTSPNLCSSQASEHRDRVRRYGKLANPASIGMSVPVLANDLAHTPLHGTRTSTVLLAVAPSAIGFKWKLTW